MGPIAIRQHVHRYRRRGAALLALLVVACAVAAHHSVISMAEMHHDGLAGAAVELCLGVFVAVGAAVAAVAIGLISLGRWRPPAALTADGLSRRGAAPPPSARAGPALLSLLCVSRC